MPSAKRPTDQRIESIIAGLLTAGVALAALTVLAGGILYLSRYGSTMPDYRAFRGEPSDLRTLGGIVADAAAGHSRGITLMGLLILIATPVARVAFSVVAFLRQRDRLYVVVTLIVLAFLLFSLAGGVG